jgi:ABC-type spermidine/putrescine transport system permease subunit II
LVRINTDARDLSLQVALLVSIIASLMGLLNAFRMRRLPDIAPSASLEGTTLG